MPCSGTARLVLGAWDSATCSWVTPACLHLPLSRVGAAQASTFQMAILLQYNTEDAYAVQQLTDSTQIKMVPAPPPLSLAGAVGRGGEGRIFPYEFALLPGF